MSINPDQFSKLLGDYIDKNLRGQDLAKLTKKRDVRMYINTWQPWFKPDLIDNYGSLDKQTSQLALSLLDAPVFATPQDPSQQDHRVIGRETLLELAITADASPDPDNRLRLWIATMMWGSGTTNGRGPRNLRKSLADGRLPDYLKSSADLIKKGDPKDYNDPKRDAINGAQLAFRSKWLWASSLASPPEVPPLILDARVRACLDRASRRGSRIDRASRRGSRIRYADYLTLAHDTARRLEGGITSETVEYLLFERRQNSNGRVPFFEWLAPNTDPQAL